MSDPGSRHREWEIALGRCSRLEKVIKSVEREAKRWPKDAPVLLAAAAALQARLKELETEAHGFRFHG